jgi:hypothetical protein
MEKKSRARIRDENPGTIYENLTSVFCSVADPDPYVFEPPGSGSVSQRYGSKSFYHQVKIGRKTLSKNSRKTSIYTVFGILNDFLTLENNVYVHSKGNEKKLQIRKKM